VVPRALQSLTNPLRDVDTNLGSYPCGAGPPPMQCLPRLLCRSMAATSDLLEVRQPRGSGSSRSLGGAAGLAGGVAGPGPGPVRSPRGLSEPPPTGTPCSPPCCPPMAPPCAGASQAVAGLSHSLCAPPLLDWDSLYVEADWGYRRCRLGRVSQVDRWAHVRSGGHLRLSRWRRDRPLPPAGAGTLLLGPVSSTCRSIRIADAVFASADVGTPLRAV
jgi:hypothetical protein